MELKVQGIAQPLLWNLPCNSSGAGLGKTSDNFVSWTQMINGYSLTANYSWSGSKTCTPCKECISGTYWINFTAKDRTNFDAGKKFGNRLITITDALINACSVGNPFDVTSFSSASSSIHVCKFK